MRSSQHRLAFSSRRRQSGSCGAARMRMVLPRRDSSGGGEDRQDDDVDPILSEIAQDNNGTYYFSRSYKDGKPPNK